jgi:hypothetical protein
MTATRSNTIKREAAYFEAGVRRAFAELPTIEACRAPIDRLSAIRAAVASAFHVDVADITSSSRWTVDVMARHAFMGMAMRLTNCSLPKIALYCGGVNHTTVLRGSRRYQDTLDRIFGPAPDRVATRDTLIKQRERKLYESLARLIKWSRSGEFAVNTDIFPNDKYRLAWMRRRGFAEYELDKSTMVRMWRVTDAGRAAYRAYQDAHTVERVAGSNMERVAA